MKPVSVKKVLDALAKAQNNVTARQVLLDRAREHRADVVMKGKAIGLTHQTMGEAMGLSKDRVNQIIMAKKKTEEGPTP